MPLIETISATLLREVPLLKDLSATLLESLRPHLHACEFRKGEPILRVGDYCDGAYYSLKGRVDARLPAAASTRARRDASVLVPEVPVALKLGEQTILEPGEIFGEGSALSRYPIAIDLTASSDVSCVLIRTPALRAMFDVPELAGFKELFERRYRERTLRSHLRRVDLFADLDEAALERLVDRAELRSFKPKEVIAEEGQPCDAFYLVRGGYVKVSVRTSGADLAVTYLRMGDWIGEATLCLNEPWPVSLTAIDHVELVRLSLEDIRPLLSVASASSRLWDVMIERLKQRGRTAVNPSSSRPLQFAMESELIRGESVLLIDLERCTRCDECVRACADAHDGTPRFVREGIKFQNFSVPTACYQCSDPVCMIGCPTGAITRPLGSLEVAIDASTCIGCGNCVKRCPWGNILTVPFDSPRVGERINLATKCDLCIGRPEGPACVQMCPQGCAQRVSFKDSEQVTMLFSG